MANTPPTQASDAATSSTELRRDEIASGGGTDCGRDDRGREMAGAERVGDEQDREGVRAGCGSAEDETLLQPDAVRCEPDPDGGEPREQPGLGARHSLGGSEEPGTEKGERKSGDRGGRHAGDGLVEDQLRRCVDEKHVRRGDGAVDERGCLDARIAHPQGDERQEQRLGRPGEREARSRQQVGGGDGGQRQRRHAEHEGEGRLEAAQRDPGDGPDHGRAGERDALIAVDVPQRPHEQEREADGGEHERARERIEIGLPGDELQPDSRCEHDQHERGDDGGGACTRRARRRRARAVQPAFRRRHRFRSGACASDAALPARPWRRG